jgi:hypothetical protein
MLMYVCMYELWLYEFDNKLGIRMVDAWNSQPMWVLTPTDMSSTLLLIFNF